MLLSHFPAVSPPGFTIRPPANHHQLKLRANLKTQFNKKQTKKNKPTTKNKSSNLGFNNVKKEPVWQCVKSCGACCKLDKGPSFPSPDEIFDDPSDIELFRSMIGPDGWCVHFEMSSRTCKIYADRPYFCRVEPDIFEQLYGIEKKKFNKEACSSCVDTIKAIYGSQSKELDNFNHTIRGKSVE
ncbi:Retinoic acid-induced 3 [Heracleum sosnowskyi]|uniref:Retinoic acid-induced 3 n=1 Tax=Heracleum sosnowskyi TaxID=360622 RepID=A0AAD8JA35_9APIA|nr:Retinoic acid-induced 3 [Heracleum sosnowskyi]